MPPVPFAGPSLHTTRSHTKASFQLRNASTNAHNGTTAGKRKPRTTMAEYRWPLNVSLNRLIRTGDHPGQ